MKETREKLVAIFEQNHLPLTEIELRDKLTIKRVKVNKTTIYRQLEQMIELNLIKRVDFGDGKNRFELNLHNHHHHLICTKCERVEDIFVHKDVEHIENKIHKDFKFQIKSHSLEFFGLCRNCQ